MLQDLPELFLDLVWGHLSYEDFLALRCTCKGLKRFADQKKFTKLNLFIKKYSFYRQLFYTNNVVGYPNSYHSNSLTILSSNRFREQFCNLQRLIISGNSDPNSRRRLEEKTSLPGVNLDDLNHFKRLKQLQIDEMLCARSSCIKGKLNLQELQIASFTPCGLSDSSFELNCPKLRALKIAWCSPVLSSETSGLDELHVGEHGFENSKDPLVKNISNLQKLFTIRFNQLSKLMRFLDDLEANKLSLPALRQIRLEKADYYKQLNKLAVKFEDFQAHPRLKHIKFALNGKPINSPSELRQITNLINIFDSKIHYWDSLTEDTFFLLNANPMLDFMLPAVSLFCLNESIESSEEIAKNLNSLKGLTFGERGKLSETIFEPFARNCRLLASLSFCGQPLTERLLEMISNQLVNLQSIKIEKCKCETLRPLAKSRNLESLELDFSLPRDELSFIYKNSRTLEKFNFFCGSPPVYLLRTIIEPRVHRITRESQITQLFQTNFDVYFDTLDDMVDHFYANRLFEDEVISSVASVGSFRSNKSRENCKCC